MGTQKSQNQRVKAVFRQLLFPFSAGYGALTDARNYLFDAGYRTRHRAAVPTVSVGNLTVGGTGKTPHVEYLVRLLQTRFLLATLSRGYGRRTRGFRLAGPTDTPETLGDEPLQVYQKFGPDVVVAVGERRVDALQLLNERVPDRQVVLLDDAFQHRPLQPDVNLLLTDFQRPFYEDDPFPGGRLRERRHGARRADAVVVTKCPPTMDVRQRSFIETRIRRYARPEVPIFFSTLTYGVPVALTDAPSLAEPVLLVSGLANADRFEADVRQHFRVTEHRRFPDHHAYTPGDWREVEALARQTGAKSVLMTEKDAVKFKTRPRPYEWTGCPVFFLPVAVRFLFDEGGRFDRWVLEQIERRAAERSRHSTPAA